LGDGPQLVQVAPDDQDALAGVSLHQAADEGDLGRIPGGQAGAGRGAPGLGIVQPAGIRKGHAHLLAGDGGQPALGLQGPPGSLV